jgi:hypothetical protein
MRFFTTSGGTPPALPLPLPHQSQQQQHLPHSHPHPHPHSAMPPRGMAPPLFALPHHPSQHPGGPGGPFVGQPRGPGPQHPGMMMHHPQVPHIGHYHQAGPIPFSQAHIPPHGAIMPGLKANPPHPPPHFAAMEQNNSSNPSPVTSTSSGNLRRSITEIDGTATSGGGVGGQQPPTAAALLQLLRASRDRSTTPTEHNEPESGGSPLARRVSSPALSFLPPSSSTPPPTSSSSSSSTSSGTPGLLLPSAILAHSRNPSSRSLSTSGSLTNLLNTSGSLPSFSSSSSLSRGEFQQVMQKMLQDDRFLDLFYQEFLRHQRRVVEETE